MSPAYEIKGIKNFKGHEGEPCAQGSLYRGTKKVCEWSDSSTGGSMHVRFVSPEEEAAFVPFAREYLSARPDVLGEPYELAKMSDWHIAAEAVERMSYDAAEEAELRKLCKNKLVFKVKSSQEGEEPEIMTLNVMFTESEVARVKAEHKDLIEIVNERFGTPLKDESPEHLAAETVFYRKECAKKTLFVRVVDGVRQVLVLSRPYTPAIGKQLRAKYPDILRILNEVV
jgi:hypothetical protein